MDNLVNSDKDTELKFSAGKGNSSSVERHSFSQGEEIIEKIPLFAENFDVTKKTEETQLNLTLKWMTTTKKIEIPIRYEEMLINDKEFDSFNESEITEMFSKIKHKITDVFLHHEKGKDNEEGKGDGQQQQHHLQKQKSHHQSDEIEVKIYDKKSNKKHNKNQNELNEKFVPFSLDGKNTDDISINKQEENILPLWGEEITINKKMVKIGEIIIRKYQTKEKQKIDVDVKKEKITIKYPDNHKEEIT
jgi:stress response protein YsnF